MYLLFPGWNVWELKSSFLLWSETTKEYNLLQVKGEVGKTGQCGENVIANFKIFELPRASLVFQWLKIQATQVQPWSGNQDPTCCGAPRPVLCNKEPAKQKRKKKKKFWLPSPTKVSEQHQVSLTLTVNFPNLICCYLQVSSPISHILSLNREHWTGNQVTPTLTLAINLLSYLRQVTRHLKWRWK